MSNGILTVTEVNCNQYETMVNQLIDLENEMRDAERERGNERRINLGHRILKIRAALATQVPVEKSSEPPRERLTYTDAERLQIMAIVRGI